MSKHEIHSVLAMQVENGVLLSRFCNASSRVWLYSTAQITDVAYSLAGGEQSGWQNGVHEASDGKHLQGQQQLAKGKEWQPPARSAAWGMRVTAADIDLNTLQYVGKHYAVAVSEGRAVPACQSAGL